jgi:hypothetical protein
MAFLSLRASRQRCERRRNNNNKINKKEGISKYGDIIFFYLDWSARGIAAGV